MKLVDKIASQNGRPFYTFEFFPPRTEQVLQALVVKLHAVLSRSLAGL
jgi:5,10-methylenetetrahydrofolate reductase